MATTNQKAMALLELCQKFVTDQRISCGDAVYQTDSVIENAYDLIFNICEIVGYYEYPEE